MPEAKEKTRSAPKRNSGSAIDFILVRSGGDLVTTDQEVDPDLEIISLQKHFDGHIQFSLTM